MPRQLLGSLVACLLIVVPLLAQHASKSKPKPAEMEARFHDGSNLCKVELQQDVVVVTKDGKVTVPASDIRRIEFGLRVPKETAVKIEHAIGRLRSGNFAEREAATKELAAFGYQAYPALRTARKNSDLEMSR